MNEAQLIFLGVLTLLALIVIAALIFTDFADHLPTDPWGPRKQ